MALGLQEIAILTGSQDEPQALRSTRIGGIDVQVSIEEVYDDRVEVTEHPVQRGANITDHSYRTPSELLIRCGWSDSSREADRPFSGMPIEGGTMAAGTFVAAVYSQLLALQQARKPITIMTGLRAYQNMLITAVQVTRDQKTANALMVEATCREVLLVSTESTSLPPQENHANPAATAQVKNAGTKRLRVGHPAPGGSVPPEKWTGR